MTWAIEFFPDQAQSVSITIDGVHDMDWKSAEGHVIKGVSKDFNELGMIHVRADNYPDGQEAIVNVLWNGLGKKTMKFSHGEDHDVKCTDNI